MVPFWELGSLQDCNFQTGSSRAQNINCTSRERDLLHARSIENRKSHRQNALQETRKELPRNTKNGAKIEVYRNRIIHVNPGIHTSNGMYNGDILPVPHRINAEVKEKEK
jgi:hypothetical protein